MDWKKSVIGPPGREIEFMDRKAWGAKNPTFFKPLFVPVSYLVQEVTDTHTCRFDADCIRTVRKLQAEHMKEDGVPDIKYKYEVYLLHIYHPQSINGIQNHPIVIVLIIVIS